MLKVLLVIADSFLVLSGLKTSPDSNIVKSFGAKYFIIMFIKVVFVWLLFQSATKNWDLAGRIVKLQKENKSLNKNVSILLHSNEYLIDRIEKGECNEKNKRTKAKDKKL